MSGPKIVVVEDDPSIAGSIVRALTKSGFAVALATDGLQGVAQASAPDTALVVLDLMLPELDGVEVLSRIRARTAAPIIVVSARTELAIRVEVFAQGAVDYLPKPFFVEELLARIYARLGPEQVPGNAETFGPLTVDRERRAVTLATQPLALTPTEFLLLAALTRRPGRALSRSELARVLADPEEASPRHLDAHVTRLRKKLGELSTSIVTVWGHGYRFDPPMNHDDPHQS